MRELDFQTRLRYFDLLFFLQKQQKKLKQFCNSIFLLALKSCFITLVRLSFLIKAWPLSPN